MAARSWIPAVVNRIVMPISKRPGICIGSYNYASTRVLPSVSVPSCTDIKVVDENSFGIAPDENTMHYDLHINTNIC